MNQGNIIKDLRLQKKMTQAELAKLSNITITELSLIETGEKKPRVNTIKALAEGLSVDYEYLFDELHK